MHLTIHRTYHDEGTNGLLTMGPNSEPVCYTIELPWRNNEVNRSCIPEGTYVLKRRYSTKFRWHIEIKDVPGRSYILIHPANHAARELKGCIAPVLLLTGPGTGEESRLAFDMLIGKLLTAVKHKESILLSITSGAAVSC
jgi:hypothetical protein